ncbi:MAG: efflux RND transporter permease subunit, partial [Planctomycetota bacterium]
LGVPGVKSIRSTSMFGFSSVFVVFDDEIEFYWSRSRILEKLQSLPANTLPAGVEPGLGPDATALGQVFWYTLEGQDADGAPTGGWNPEELRSIQDFQVRYALQAVPGVAEVASIGGFVKEYQIDVDPDAMRHHGVGLDDVFRAVRDSNVDVGARTIEVNRAEYVVRGLGFLRGIEDLQQTVVRVRDGVPLTLGEVAHIGTGPALRRGALDRGGAEAVGGVVVVRHGANPMQVLDAVHQKIEEIRVGLPSRTLEDGRTSRVAIVPFYDRAELIAETVGTLGAALRQQLLVTILVVLLMVGHFRSALLISGLLPLGVLGTFVAMRGFGIDANIVALSGIAIAIGTMVDMGIVLTESILQRLRPGATVRERLEAVHAAGVEVGGAVLTAVLTTVVSFLPVFTMEGQEGKLFQPLAFTKTFALLVSILVALVVLPVAAHALLGGRGWLDAARKGPATRVGTFLAAGVVTVWLGLDWAPIGPGHDAANVGFTAAVVGGTLGLFALLERGYEPLLRACLAAPSVFLTLPFLATVLGLTVWLGYAATAPVVFGASVLALVFQLGPLVRAGLGGATPRARALGAAALVALVALGFGLHRYAMPWGTARAGTTAFEQQMAKAFPGLGKQFMPPLDEGAFLLMPVTGYHASIGEAMDVLQTQDRAIRAIPEVRDVVGKIGRVDSPLDPAPVGMIETVVTYHPEYRTGPDGELLRFRHDGDRFVLGADHQLVPDPEGQPFRNWRPGIEGPSDIWNEVEAASRIVGTTRASLLGPIETRRVMLQTGMRSPLGVKVRGPDLATVERVALAIQERLQEVPQVSAETVIAERVVGKPYLQIEIDRPAIARHGLSVRAVQDVIEVALGGRPVTRTVEGRERYPVRVRYLRELRDRIDEVGDILVPSPTGAQIPLAQLAQIRYAPGPSMIRSEDTFLTAYVTFGARAGEALGDVVAACQTKLDADIAAGLLEIPPGVAFRFAGEFENQLRAEAKLRVVLPLARRVIFLLIWFQFRSSGATLLVFSGVFVAWSGGFLLLWLYGQPWFLDGSILGRDLQDLFQVEPVFLSVAVWVGFLALFGVATDDGVLMGTYLKQSFADRAPTTRAEVREAVVAAGMRRIRPCLMTSATTVLALLPVLTSQGRGADVMLPMAIPSFGGMLLVLITIFVVPTLWSVSWERKVRRLGASAAAGEDVREG